MITEAQREQRRKYLGASEMAAALNLDPYRSSYDVWLEKTGRAEDFAGNEHTERGNLLEPVLLEWAAGKLGEIEYPETIVVGNLCANLDGRVKGKPENVEAKTGVESDEWGDPDEQPDALPQRYLIQMLTGMHLAKSELCWAPALLAGYRRFDFRMYCVPYVKLTAEAICEQGERFMVKHVRADTPPDDSMPSLEVLKRIRRQPEKVVPIDRSLVEKYIVLNAAKSQAEEDADAAKVALIKALGDAEGGDYGKGIVTYMQQTRKAHSVKESTFRKLAIKSAK